MKRSTKILFVLCAVAAAALGAIQANGQRRAALEARLLTQQLAARRQELARLHRAPHPSAKAASVDSGGATPAPIAPSASGDAQFDAELRAVVTRVQQMKTRLLREPRMQIPELRFLSDTAWFEIAEKHPRLEIDLNCRVALAELRETAEGNFTLLLSSAARAYLKASGEKAPAATADLGPYFVTAVDETLLARYEIESSRFIRLLNRTMGGDGPPILRKAPAVDPEAEKLLFATRSANETVSSLPVPAFLGDTPPTDLLEVAALGAALQSFRAAHPDREARDAAELAGYFDDKGDAERFLKWAATLPPKR